MSAAVPAPRAAVAHLDLVDDVPFVVVDVATWLDVSTAPGLEAVVEVALAARPPRLAVDLSRCESADPFGLGVLARLAARARKQGTHLVLTGVNERVQRVLLLLGLARQLRVDNTLVPTQKCAR